MQVCNTAWNNRSGKLNTGRGNYWFHGTAGADDVQHRRDAQLQAVSLGLLLECGHRRRGDSSTANSNHPGGVNILMADGSVRFAKDSINQATWWALGTRANGEVISADSY